MYSSCEDPWYHCFSEDHLVSMTGHEFCAVYLAVKLHFTNEKYNFFSGSGKAKIGVDAFQKRKDKYLFHKLARKLDDAEVVPFLVSNFVYSGQTWTRTLLDEDASEIYTNWKKNVESLSYVFEHLHLIRFQ